MSGQTFISFTQQDLALFSEASGDRNPLHLNAGYARHTPYGQQVVFGCLGALACLGQLRWPAGTSVASLEAEFLRPMFLGVRYRIETWEKDGKQGALLFDGSTSLLSVTVIAGPALPDRLLEHPSPPASIRHEAILRTTAQIVPGLAISGTYSNPSAAPLTARWGPVDPLLITLFSWASYLVGMELPGESALFSKMVLTCPGTVPCSRNLDYRASVASVHSRSGQIRMDVALLTGDSTLASGQFWSYMRPSIPDLEEIDPTGIPSDSLAGRTAVLIGASRGLGAALKHALELRGATVYSMARSAATSSTPALTEVGDAADPEALQRLRERVLNERGRLDFLVCNACPPILPLRLEPNGAARIAAYIQQAVALTLAPLSEFLEPLERSEGCAVIISSSAVEHPVREWPHYLAAKQAVEMLARVAALQYPRVRSLIVRPPKLLTTMTNTPLGRLGAASPAALAHRIATRLESPLEPGKAETLA